MPAFVLVALLFIVAGTARAQSPVIGALDQLGRSAAPGWAAPRGLNVLTGSLFDHKPKRVEVPLEGGRCYRLLLAASQSVRKVAVTWTAPDGTVLGSSPALGTEVMLEGCPASRGLNTFDLLSAVGDGSFGLRMVQPPAPPPPAVALPLDMIPDAGAPAASQGAPPDRLESRAPAPVDPLAPALAEAVHAFAPDVHSPPVTEHRGVISPEALPYEFRANLAARACYVFAAVGSIGVQELSIYVWDPGDHRIDQTREQRRPALKFCAKESGPYHFLVKATTGGGGFSSAVYPQ